MSQQIGTTVDWTFLSSAPADRVLPMAAAPFAERDGRDATQRSNLKAATERSAQGFAFERRLKPESRGSGVAGPAMAGDRSGSTAAG